METQLEKPERIALIMGCPVRQHGGVEILVRELVVQLSEKCEIILVTEDERDDIPPSLARHIVGHVPLSKNHCRTTGDALAKELKILKVNVAHFHLGGTYGLNSRNFFQCPISGCIRAGIPYLITNHGVFGFFGYLGAQQSLALKIASLPFFWLSRLLFIKFGRGEIMVSNNDLRKMRRWFFPLRARMGMLYHSVLPEHAGECAKGRVKRFLCVGTIASRKGQWLLVRAFAAIHEHLPEWRVCIAGRFTDDATRSLVLDAMADPAVAARIDLIHDASDDEIKELYLTSEVFVMPSLEEGLGLTLQEALYHGCACVTTRAGGTEDLVSNLDNGLLVDRNDATQLADAMLKIASDSQLRAKLVERGRASVVEKNMSREGMANAYLTKYKTIVSRTKRTQHQITI